MAKFLTLYSGSSGNCAVVEEAGRFLMVDMGASCRATLGAMVGAGLSPRHLDGILVTHEHSDHIKGLRVFLKKVPVPVFATTGTLRALEEADAVPPGTELVAMDEESLSVGGFLVENFFTSHDAAASCGWRLTTSAGAVMALATDLGCMTQPVYQMLQATRLVALEANYDPEMLRLGRYPAYLKRRIASSQGHLSNDESAQVVARLIAAGCQKVVLCHLSEENNRPHLVRRAVEDALLQHGLRMPLDDVQLAKRHERIDWIEF